MPLSKDQILAVQDVLPPLEFHVPEWNDSVLLKFPTANERDAWEVYCQSNKDKPKAIWRAELAARLIVDKDGVRMFTTPDEIRQLGDHSAAAIHRIWEKGLELMSISEQEVDELEKN